MRAARLKQIIHGDYASKALFDLTCGKVAHETRQHLQALSFLEPYDQ
ncbi:MAG: hypothetical protein KUF74_06945 [Candidatus Thiodiazotropha sp. (ex Ctena orbiculata)]|nr:hypothetical protein [Candidatus Thiodiazotropha taylori]